MYSYGNRVEDAGQKLMYDLCYIKTWNLFGYLIVTHFRSRQIWARLMINEQNWCIPDLINMDVFDLIKEGKIKRFFRATWKLSAPDPVYRITRRAAGKESLFLENNDYLFMIRILRETSQNHPLRMHAFCLMQNHVYLLFSPQEDNLYDAMRNLFSRYVMRFNRKYQRKGHLFGGHYRQAVCPDDSYLLAASVYIHLNPVKISHPPDCTAGMMPWNRL